MIPDNAKPIIQDRFTGNKGISPNARTRTCAPDTVLYALAKASALRGLTINSVTSAQKVAQWFPAPQPVTIHGATFFAWQNNGTPNPVTVTCKVILAGNDSLPTGPTVATATVSVDTVFGAGQLSVLEKTVAFNPPVTVSFPYVITVENVSANSIAIVTSAYDSTDGKQEWLAMANIGGTWLHSYNINVGGAIFDADFLLQPVVSYSIDADFVTDTNCILNGGNIQFTNLTADPIIQSKFYNQYIFDNTPRLIYVWNFDDGSPLHLVFDTSHFFAPGLNYEVTLTVNVAGWSVSCQDVKTEIINPSTESNFTWTQNGLTAQFSNQSSGNAWLWLFGDGDSSTAYEPTHTYAVEGNYNVVLITYGTCYADTAKQLLQMCNPISSDFTYSSLNDSVFQFVVSSITGTGSYTWNFGDGNAASGVQVNHTYTAPGNYVVCLKVTNACISDSTCKNITVSFPTGVIHSVHSTATMLLPNPATGFIVVEAANPARVRILNHSGNIVLETFIHQGRETIDISRLPAGVYLLQSVGAGEAGKPHRFCVIR